jgi:hypothetical protein
MTAKRRQRLVGFVQSAIDRQADGFGDGSRPTALAVYSNPALRRPSRMWSTPVWSV